jgi:predicted nucleotidyltransferase
MSNEYLEPYKSILKSIQGLLDQFPEQGVIVGGIAITILGEQRFTADVDILVLVSNDQLSSFHDACMTAGFTSRVADLIAFARQNRVIPMVHTESGLKADFIMGMLPLEKEIVARSKKVIIENIEITLPTVEDLIIMKAIAHRPKDLTDISGLARKNKKLDLKRIEYWVRQFGEALEQPDLWDSIQKYLKS